MLIEFIKLIKALLSGIPRKYEAALPRSKAEAEGDGPSISEGHKKGSPETR
jgi:hypothetical protein